MLYFLIITKQCDLHCSYCGSSLPLEQHDLMQYSVEDLNRFIKADPDPRIIFYGGEPLLHLERVRMIMESINAQYLLQTNGLRLASLPDDLLHQFKAILVSIDGRPKITDHHRGKGVYARIIANVQFIRDRQYTGDLIARMTVSEQTDIYQDVTHLLTRVTPHFDHVHWQLDVLWDDSPQIRWNDFRTWQLTNYHPGITRLVQEWLQTITQQAIIPGIVPFQGIMKRLLFNAPTGLPCGAGLNAFSIDLDGALTVCPVSTEYSFATLGTLQTHFPQDLPNRVCISDPCPTCEIYPVCGGRCLFANKTQFW